MLDGLKQTALQHCFIFLSFLSYTPGEWMTGILQEQLVSLVDQLGREIPAEKPGIVSADMIPVLGL